MALAADLAAHLQTRMTALHPGITWKYGLAAPNNIFKGPPQPADASIDKLSIFVVAWGGPAPIHLKDAGTKVAKLDQQMAKVYLRVTRKEFNLGETLGDKIVEAVDGVPPTGYYEAQALSSHMEIWQADPQQDTVWLADFLISKRVNST
jgi:hypothetical protein